MKTVKTPLAPLKKGARVVFLKKENDLNKILKAQKRTKETINILFVSPWDEWCETLLTKVDEQCNNPESREVLYVVNSFSMPHSFVIFKSLKLPHLVRLQGDRSITEDYLPLVYRFLGVS